MKKIITVLLSFLMTLSVVSFPVNAETEETIPGELKKLEATSVEADVYVYTASVINDPAPMLTPIIFIYNENGYESLEEAQEKLLTTGLIDIAEKERGVIMLMSPSNKEEGWGENDVEVYWDILKVFTASDEMGNPANEFGFNSWTNLIYAMGEGEGATFIHNLLSQNAHRIAGVITVGGEINAPENLMPLPAYLVNANDKVIEFYKQINDTDTQTTTNGNDTYYNSTLDLKKVIVSSKEDTTLTKEVIAEGWQTLLRTITRNVMNDPVWLIDAMSLGEKGRTEEIFVLMDRPNPEDESLIFTEVTDTGIEGQTRYYTWVPEEALETDNTETFALVISYPGTGDHPVFEAESQGWVEVAAKERIILVAPDDCDTGTSEENIARKKALIDYICETYPVDKSRIYATGFSGGGTDTRDMANAFPSLFAAIAPMSAYPSLKFTEETCSQLDLPIFYESGMSDCLLAFPSLFASAELEYSGESYMYPGIVAGYINQAIAINELGTQIDTNNLDFVTYPFIGFNASEYAEIEEITTKHGLNMHVYSYTNEDGITMFKHVTVEDYDHNHYAGWAPLFVWDFFNDFSRDQETLEIIYSNEEVVNPPIDDETSNDDTTLPDEDENKDITDETPDNENSNDSTTSTPEKGEISTQTGDNTNLTPLVFMGIMSTVGLVICIYKKKMMS